MTGQRDGYALQKAAILVTGDVTLAAYFQSILAYFTGTAKPNETLLTLKLKELIVTILLGGKNPELAGYFQSLLKSDPPVLSQIMEANFSYNLALEDFARLSHRSLSTFKRDFRKYYNQFPGKWLLQKRLDYSAVLLKMPRSTSRKSPWIAASKTSRISAGRLRQIWHLARAFRKETPGSAGSQVIKEDVLQAAQKDRELRGANIDKAETCSCALTCNRSKARKRFGSFRRALSQIAHKAQIRDA